MALSPPGSAPSSLLRPLTVVELLDSARLAVQQNWAALYGAAAAGTLPLVLLLFAYFRWTGGLVQGTENSRVYGAAALWGLAMALAWSGHCLARGAVTSLALATLRGAEARPREAWRRAAGQWPTLVYAGLVPFAACWLAAGCLVLPGTWLMAGWWVARPVALEEGRPFGAALRRSWRLTTGHRGRAASLWCLFLLLWGVGLLNLHLGAHLLLAVASQLLGLDFSLLAAQLSLANQAYLTLLIASLLVLLDPLKCAADAAFYLDLRIRREGADLQERLAAMEQRPARAGNGAGGASAGSRTGAALGVLVLALAAVAPASAAPLERYLQQVRELRRQVEADPAGRRVDPRLVAELRQQLVALPDGQQLTVRNNWLPESLGRLRNGEPPQALLLRLEALERTMVGPGGNAPPASTARSPAGAPPTAAGDPRDHLQALLLEPEFQQLAERPELRELLGRFDARQARSWWDSFVRWLQQMLFRPANPPVQQPRAALPDLTAAAYVALAVAILFVLALLARWFVERPQAEDAAPAAPAAATPLTASATENALDHSADEWERFAAEWLSRGDVRQAVRALYLATLVHLHREGLIEYDRALTNWAYVRHFRGGDAGRNHLRALTRVFDAAWYGLREPSSEQLAEFREGARALGTPIPAGGNAHG